MELCICSVMYLPIIIIIIAYCLINVVIIVIHFSLHTGCPFLQLVTLHQTCTIDSVNIVTVASRDGASTYISAWSTT